MGWTEISFTFFHSCKGDLFYTSPTIGLLCIAVSFSIKWNPHSLAQLNKRRTQSSSAVYVGLQASGLGWIRPFSWFSLQIKTGVCYYIQYVSLKLTSLFTIWLWCLSSSFSFRSLLDLVIGASLALASQPNQTQLAAEKPHVGWATLLSAFNGKVTSSAMARAYGSLFFDYRL